MSSVFKRRVSTKQLPSFILSKVSQLILVNWLIKAMRAAWDKRSGSQVLFLYRIIDCSMVLQQFTVIKVRHFIRRCTIANPLVSELLNSPNLIYSDLLRP